MRGADLCLIFGTRPSYIKLWPVWHALRDRGVAPHVICTGQHDALVRQHMDLLGMPVDRWLHVMRDSRDLNDTLALVVQRVDCSLTHLQPRLVLVHGDTTSALGSGFAAFHRGIPVAHVEAGLRSGHPGHPFPEEVNRITLDALMTLGFAPTERAYKQARAVNSLARLEVTGNPVVDAVQHMMGTPAFAEARACYAQQAKEWGPYIVLELHRRESFGSCLDGLVNAVMRSAMARGFRVVWPVHPNPAVQAAAVHAQGWERMGMLVPPMDYGAFLARMAESVLVVTDSGGIVEEAPTLGVPTLQLREYTDRVEAIPAVSWLAGRDPAKIFDLVGVALDNTGSWRRQIEARRNPFGDGMAGKRIATEIIHWLERS